jgi:hypothetical protein
MTRACPSFIRDTLCRTTRRRDSGGHHECDHERLVLPAPPILFYSLSLPSWSEKTTIRELLARRLGGNSMSIIDSPNERERKFDKREFGSTLGCRKQIL